MAENLKPDDAVVNVVTDMLWGSMWHSRPGTVEYHRSKPDAPQGIRDAVALAVAMSDGGLIRFDHPAVRALIDPYRHEPPLVVPSVANL